MPSSNLKMHTPNLVDSNIERIAELFPNCITEKPKTDEQGNVLKDASGQAILERGIDFELLKQELSHSVIDGSQERYRLDWVGKREAIVTANSPIAKTLRPCRDESVDFETTGNLFIEGDNLEALKLLQESYLGKVKMIYIDPPYNTGNDFIYNDDFAADTAEFFERSGQVDGDGNRLVANTESNGRFHSDWLSMMYSRLKLARNLLSDDGVIFISIDDNEQANLKKICDEIFGSDNFIGGLTVENNPKGRKNSSFISVSAEYCIVYSKNKNKSCFIENIPKNSKDMIKDEEGNFVHNSGKRVLVGENNFNNVVTNSGSDKNYSVYYNSDKKEVILKKEKFGEIDTDLIVSNYKKYFSHYEGELIENTYTKQKFLELFGSNALSFTENKIYEKNFSDTIRIKSILTNRKYEAIVNGEIKEFSPELTTTGAGTYLKNLFNTTDLLFSAPKNVGFLKVLISLFEAQSFLILDFFAGSSTTADAVMHLNAIDGGNRKFIMVQIPEATDSKSEAFKAGYPTIAEISKERIRRAGAKIKADNADKDGINELDTGFRVLKIDTSNMNDIYYRPQDYNQDLLATLENNIKEDRSDEDLLFQFMLDTGVPLSLPIERTELSSKSGGHTIYQVGGNSLIASLDYIDANMVNDIAALNPLKFITSERAIATDSDKTNIKERFKQLSPHTDVRFI